MGNCASKDDVSKQSKQDTVSKKENSQQRSSSLSNNNGQQHPSRQHSTSSSSASNEKSIYPSIQHEKRWNEICTNHISNIVDPADVHTIIEECIAASIQNLHSAEMTLLSRRVRKVVRSLLADGGSKTNGAASTSTKGLIRSNTSSNGVYENKSRSIYQKENVLDEYLVKRIFIGGSRFLSIGIQEGWATQSLNSYLMRHNKKNGNNYNSALWDNFVNNDNSNNDEDDESDLKSSDDDSNQQKRPINMNHNRRNITKDGKRKLTLSSSTMNNASSTNHNKSNSKQGKHHRKQNVRSNGHGKDKDTLSNSSHVADIFSSAYILLLHLCEPRWNHVANIAKLSAKDANLLLDVNEQTRRQAYLRSNKSESTRNTAAAAMSSENCTVPKPPPEYPSNHEPYTNDQSSPMLPNGVTLQEISYIVATALRSSRQKRLMLLFTLLLPAQELKELLESHPAGGIPSWILEADSDYILSYASLSHYYYYGGTPTSSSPDHNNLDSSSSSMNSMFNGFFPFSNSERNKIPNPPPAVKELRINSLTAIETIAVLLHYNLPPNQTFASRNDRGDEKSNTLNNNDEIPMKPMRERTLSYGDKKYHAAKMHLMLADYLRKLQKNSDDTPIFENQYEQKSRSEMLDSFWNTSYSQYSAMKKQCDEGISISSSYPTPPVDLNGGSTNPSVLTTWSLGDFVAWCDESISDDAALDIIMYQLFGMGLLPTPAMERKLVSESWVEWQLKEEKLLNQFLRNDPNDTFSLMTQNLKNLLSFTSSKDSEDHDFSNSFDDSGVTALSTGCSDVWGGIGGFDGKGGLGYGVMYCVDKKWWDHWEKYVGWEWTEGTSLEYSKRSRKRPHEISTEKLLDRSSDSIIPGTLGSYEIMKDNLKKDVNYVLVPSAVWDILYELYGGGPPLPRMILKFNEEVVGAMADNNSIDITSREKVVEKPMRIPKSLDVITHPRVLECRVCDPHQPYRRGEVGPMSVRMMATSDQPLWRLFAEIVLRLPIVHPRGKDSKGKGCARLWKKVEEKTDQKENKTTVSPARYGPWELLLKSGSGAFPVGDNVNIDPETYETFKQSWIEYSGNYTIESVGLLDGDKMMFEYALVGNDGKFTWPRDAAAKAGKLQRENDEEIAFRRKLRGLNAKGKLVKNVKVFVGMVIDAMDASGRWYQAEIGGVDTATKEPTTDTETDDESTGTDIAEEKTNIIFNVGEVRAVKVDFSDVGGEEEWISVDSDRLAVHKRFTLDSMKSVDQINSSKTGNEANGNSKPSSLIVLRKHSSKEPSKFQLQTSVCSFPGFGACGLNNLGNTCYANSAIQCISYMPLLRSYLLSGKFKRNGDLNRDNPLGSGGKILEEFAELLRGIWSGKNGFIQPSRLRSSLSRARQQYAGTEQQDAQELLNDMLDIMHEDSNKIMKKPFVEALEDDWVDKTSLSRVGEETWRRYLRRNRSIISSICMGQVLNRVTCPMCNHTSRIFEPFNMLSLPFPTVTEVLFRCMILRRATALNCSQTLGLGQNRNVLDTQLPPPSQNLIAEEYVISISRVADITELRQELSKLCGIAQNRFELYTMDEDTSDSANIKENMTLTHIPIDKNGPCWHFSHDYKKNATSNKTSMMIAFELTIQSRPKDIIQTDEKKASNIDNSNARTNKNLIGGILKTYGDNDECRTYDTNPSYLAGAMSKILWPKSALDITEGLRVDGIDHRSHWFPGTIVDVLKTENGSGHTAKSHNMKIKVHFDNFSSKWDITYSVDDFKNGKIQPLYSHSKPKDKTLEIQVFHSLSNDLSNLFGFPFFVHCYTEWSNARAGAHILAQASRYLQGDPQNIEIQQSMKSFMGVDTKDADACRKIKEARTVIANLIDTLIDADRRYVNAIISSGPNVLKRNEVCTTISSQLSRKLDGLIPLLPFNIIVCETSGQQSQGKNGNPNNSPVNTKPFVFSLDCTLGNEMHARQEIIICWKEIKKPSENYLLTFFSPPKVSIHEQNHELLKKQEHFMKRNGNSSNAGMRLDSCLDEFCNEQKLNESECWRCPKCKDLREGRQRMNLWRLPDILTFHLKRFNCSARWREKITTKVKFPLTGLDMKEWCDKQSPIFQITDHNCIYDLIGVVNHYGGMASGHYIATIKATACSPDGSEEVEHYFNGAGVHAFGGSTDEKEAHSALWKLVRSKEKDASNLQSKAAQASARSSAESCEPLWLQFDDESVEPIPPSEVVTEKAYVLFYRRRRITPSNIAKYGTIE